MVFVFVYLILFLYIIHYLKTILQLHMNHIYKQNVMEFHETIEK